MSTICSKIMAGFDFCGTDPIIAGIDDVIVLGNKDDFTFTFDPANPNIIIGITPVAAAKLYAFKGTNNNFNATCKAVDTQNGPRYEHEIDFHIAGNSSVIKKQIEQLGKGRFFAIVYNNYNVTDAAIEAYGLRNGLRSADANRNAADEATDGSWMVKLTRPQKLREPYPQASVFIPAIPGTGEATYDTTKAAITALIAP